MRLTLIYFLQAQPAKVSWLLWTVGIFFFLAGLALLVYLMINRKRGGVEDEPEIKKLLTDEPPIVTEQESVLESAPDEILEAEITAKKNALDEVPSPHKYWSDEIAGESSVDESPEAVAVESSPSFEEAPSEVESATLPVEPENVKAEASTPAQAALIDEANVTLAHQNETQTAPDETLILSSSSAPPAVDETAMLTSAPEPEIAANEETPFSDEVWEELKAEPTSTLTSERQAPVTTQYAAFEDSATKPLASVISEASARVEPPAAQENFTPPRPRREPFEPPRIEPLIPQSEPAPSPAQTRTIAPLRTKETRIDREPVFENAKPQPVPVFNPQTEVVTAHPKADWHPAPANRKVAGAVLGLPVEASDAPLVIGKPVIAEEEIGVTGFTHYGEPTDTGDTSRGGLITFLIVLLIMGGGVAAYFKIPSFHNRVDAVLARLRTGQAPAPAVETPRAQIIPSRNPEVNKNIVKARGAVLNISQETLEELSVEITFYRGENPIEVRQVAITPATLEPSQQGTYEFEYDGSKSGGFARYSVTKLLGKNGEIKFTSAKQ
ncbi:MAG: hypothetical protein AB1757_03465 [Acidobacteriota bacterium]